MTWVDRFREHEPACRRAPIAHNTQPWTLEYRADEVVIGVDPARSLPGSDPTGRDLALGLGAFAETCMIVAAAAGLSVACDLTHPRRIRLIPSPTGYATSFGIADVEARRVARGRYAPGAVDPAVLADLEPGVTHVPSRTFARDLGVADRWLFTTPKVTRELHEWLRLRPDHPRYHRDGLTDRALGLSRIEARLLASVLRAHPAVRDLGVGALLAASGRNLLRYDGSVLVLTDRGEQPRAAGRRLMRTWLTLARHGLSVHPLSQLIDCPATAPRLAARVGAPPLAVFRVGRSPTEPTRSARLPSAVRPAPPT